MFKSLTVGALALAFLCVAGSPAQAATTKYAATLKGSDEVPPTDSKGAGTAKLKFNPDTKKLTYTLTYKGLTGEATAAHFHGPADAGANAGVELPITVGKSPIKGEATLNDSQAADLMAGKWYVNIHTAANPKGEIRGQVVAK